MPGRVRWSCDAIPEVITTIHLPAGLDAKGSARDGDEGTRIKLSRLIRSSCRGREREMRVSGEIGLEASHWSHEHFAV